MGITINEYGNPSININKILFMNDNNLIGDTKTKITYDDKGLVINGENATTDDIDETVSRKYVTSGMLEILTNLVNQLNNPTIFHPHVQDTSSNTWIINHNILGKLNIDIYDSNGFRIIGSYEIVDYNTIHILLEDSITGFAYIYLDKDYGNITYPIQTSLLTNNQIINHNLNGIVTLKVFNESNQEVWVNYQLIDNDNILLLLEENFNGFLKIFKIN